MWRSCTGCVSTLVPSSWARTSSHQPVAHPLRSSQVRLRTRLGKACMQRVPCQWAVHALLSVGLSALSRLARLCIPGRVAQAFAVCDAVLCSASAFRSARHAFILTPCVAHAHLHRCLCRPQHRPWDRCPHICLRPGKTPCLSSRCVCVQGIACVHHGTRSGGGTRWTDITAP